MSVASLASDGSIEEPLVSVVIPVYNRAQLIGRAASSALAQTYRNIELIVVDDASNDGLAAALAAFGDARLRCLAHPVNRGAAAARNTGIAASRGEFVAFLDSDDWWLPHKIERQMAAMQGQPPEVAGHVCAFAYHKPGYPPRRIGGEWSEASFARSQLFGCTCGPGTTLLCRHAVFAEIGLFDAELRRLEDWDWMLRLAAAGYRLLASAEVLAQVEAGSMPRRAEVDAALSRLHSRHHAAIARQGAGARRIFAASLHLERAGVAFRYKAYARALGSVVRSLFCYPLRGGLFYRRIIRYAAWLAAGRRARRNRDPALPAAGG